MASVRECRTETAARYLLAAEQRAESSLATNLLLRRGNPVNHIRKDSVTNLSGFETLKSNSDFRRAYARGKTYTNPALVTYVNKNRAGICRIGITTSKKIGNAVQRNRARRVIRAAFLCVRQDIQPGYDIVFVARSKTVYKKSTEILEIMQKQLDSAGLLR